jgi:hypothetical protein
MNLEAWAGVAAAEAGVRAGAPAGVRPISAKLILLQGTVEGLLKKMNVQHRMLNGKKDDEGR